MAFKKYSTQDFKPQGKFVKWDTVGMCVEGTWEGIQTSKFKDADGHAKIEGLAIIDSEAKIMPLTTALMNFFEGAFGGPHKVPHGAAFRITYTGTQVIPGQPSPMKVFDVEFDESAIPSDEIGF